MARPQLSATLIPPGLYPVHFYSYFSCNVLPPPGTADGFLSGVSLIMAPISSLRELEIHHYRKVREMAFQSMYVHLLQYILHNTPNDVFPSRRPKKTISLKAGK